MITAHSLGTIPWPIDTDKASLAQFSISWKDGCFSRLSSPWALHIPSISCFKLPCEVDMNLLLPLPSTIRGIQTFGLELVPAQFSILHVFIFVRICFHPIAVEIGGDGTLSGLQNSPKSSFLLLAPLLPSLQSDGNGIRHRFRLDQEGLLEPICYDDGSQLDRDQNLKFLIPGYPRHAPPEVPHLRFFGLIILILFESHLSAFEKDAQVFCKLCFVAVHLWSFRPLLISSIAKFLPISALISLQASRCLSSISLELVAEQPFPVFRVQLSSPFHNLLNSSRVYCRPIWLAKTEKEKQRPWIVSEFRPVFLRAVRLWVTTSSMPFVIVRSAGIFSLGAGICINQKRFWGHRSKTLVF